MRTLLKIAIIFGSLLPVAGQPTAIFTAEESQVCFGDSVEATFIMVGDGPFDVVINDLNGVYLTLTDVTSPQTVWLKPLFGTIYSVSSFQDRNGVEGTVNILPNPMFINVLPLVPVTLQIEKTFFLKTDPPVTLSSDPPGATFQGSGVLGDLFYPSFAPPEGSPHEISCVYVHTNGCPSYDATDVVVIHGEAEVELLSEGQPVQTICDDAVSYEILGSNLDDIAGLFVLRDALTQQEVTGFITDEDSSDNAALFNPAGLQGQYEIEYTYFYDDLPFSAVVQVNVNDLESMTLEGFPSLVCQADDPYFLFPGNVPNDPGATYTITGPAISGNQNDGYYFDPGSDELDLTSYTIELDYSSATGCSAEAKKTITINFSPDVSFSYSPSCLSASGGTVSFNNTTTGKFAVESWSWNFGDPGSGGNNLSSEVSPDHLYTIPGEKQVQLTAVTDEGCVTTVEQDVLLSDEPTAGVEWYHDCFVRGEEISFASNSFSEFSEIESLVWTFKNESGFVLGTIPSDDPGEVISFPFTSLANYQVELEVWDKAGCYDKTSEQIELKPTQVVQLSGYVEGFNGENQNWYPEPESSSWVLEEPDFSGFDAVAGDLAWFTRLPEQTGGVEYSHVISPCFDFTRIEKPMLSLNLMKSFLPGQDGAVVQYNLGEGAGWQTLGGVGEGENWYNAASLSNQPGGSSEGWGLLQGIQPDDSWQRARYLLNELVGERHARLRIAVAVQGNTGGYEGFAFDNISISEDYRGSVLEHFTNSTLEASMLADDIVDQFAMDNRSRVVDIQYHTDYPGEDPMNENNPDPPLGRSFQMGISSQPYAVLNGRTGGEYRYDFSGPSEVPDEALLEQISLQSAPFTLDLQVDWQASSLEATATAICELASYPGNIQLYLVVMETSVTAYTGENGDEEFRNVVLDMIPNSAGTLLGENWSQGQSDNRTFTWDYASYIEDVEDLAVVAFLSDRDNDGEIIQAQAAYLTPQVGINEIESSLRPLALYPNPAADLVYVNLGEPAREMGLFVLTDLSGRKIMETEVKEGRTVFGLDLDALPAGVYILNWMESGDLRGRAKLLKGQ